MFGGGGEKKSGKSQSGGADGDIRLNGESDTSDSGNVHVSVGSDSQAAAETKPDANKKSKRETKQEAKLNAKAGAKPQSSPGATADAKPELKLEVTPDAKPETRPDVTAAARPDAKPELKLEVTPDAKPESKPDVTAAATPDAKPDSKPDGKPEAKPETKPDVTKPATPDAKPQIMTGTSQSAAPADGAGGESESQDVLSLERDLAQRSLKLGYVPVLEAFVIGAVAGLSALWLGAGIGWLGALRVTLSSMSPGLPVLPLFGCIGGLIAGLLLLVSPETSGSGIPQVRALLNRMKMPLDIKIALVKLLGGTIALGSGLFMGREGPTVQVGAAIASQLTRWLPATVEQRRQLISAGAGAGLAAAFNAPLAGVTFVVEELLKSFKASAVSLAIVACFSASLVAHFFGNPSHQESTSQLAEIRVHPIDLVFLIALGIICGFCGAVFNRGILFSLDTYRKIRIPKPLKVAFAGLITGAIVSTLPEALHNYAAARAMINMGEIQPYLVPTLFVAFFFLTLLAYGSGTPGGLFAPSLALGSCLGYMVGHAEMTYFGTGSLELFSLVGMGAMFSAVARAPLTSIIIVFEMASNFSLVTPLMIACVVASTTGELLYKGGLYDLLMVWNGIHLHAPGDQEEASHEVTAEQVMRRRYPSLQSGITVKAALAKMKDLKKLSLPVVKRKRLIGIFTTSEIANTTDLESKNIDDVMFRHPLSVGPDDRADDLLFLFARYRFKWLAVTKNDQLIGVVEKDDLIKTMFAGADAEQHSMGMSEDTMSELEAAKETAAEMISQIKPVPEVSPRLIQESADSQNERTH